MKQVDNGKTANVKRGTDSGAAQGRTPSEVEKILSNDLTLEREARQSLGRDLEQTELRLQQAVEETLFYRKTASKQIAMVRPFEPELLPHDLLMRAVAPEKAKEDTAILDLLSL